MNGFERHGISHLSASSINLYVAAPSLWVMERLLKRRGGGPGAAAHRGTACEEGIVAGLFDQQMDTRECVAKAHARYDRLTALSGDPKRDSEREGIEGIVLRGLDALRPYGVPTAPVGDHQHKVEVRLEGVSVPFIGYLDLLYEKHRMIVDLKTTLRLPSEISDTHKRQASIYQRAMEDQYNVRFCYVTPKKHATYELETRDADQYVQGTDYDTSIRAVTAAAQRLERFLSVSDDPHELAAIVAHDPSTFYWNDQATKSLGLETYGY